MPKNHLILIIFLSNNHHYRLSLFAFQNDFKRAMHCTEGIIYLCVNFFPAARLVNMYCWSRGGGTGVGGTFSFLETSVHVKPLENLWASNFGENFGKFEKFWKIWKILKNLKNFGKFEKFWKIWKILKNLKNFKNFWKF